MSSTVINRGNTLSIDASAMLGQFENRNNLKFYTVKEKCSHRAKSIGKEHRPGATLHHKRLSEIHELLVVVGGHSVL
jgi:hypothetical protein